MHLVPRHIPLAVALSAGLAASLTACGGGGKAAPTPVSPAAGTAITIRSFHFSPNPLSAKLGDTITVTNQDGTNHTFSANDGSFDTGPFSSGSKTISLTKTGTFAYHCNVHNFMTGTIQVNG